MSKYFNSLTNENHFPKTISHWEFDCDLVTKLTGIVILVDFIQS